MFSTPLLLASCNDTIWDIAPVEYHVQVLDAEGRDLLNPETPGAIDHQAVEVIYDGKSYTLQETSTQEYLPYFYGLAIGYYYPADGYRLIFGELEGAKSYDNQQLLIRWGDGTEDVVSFTRKYRTKCNGSPKIDETWYLNGERYSKETRTTVVIVK